MSQSPDTNSSPEFDALIEFVKQSRGFDFSGYKRTTLTRRFHKRMAEVGIDNYADYQDHLQVYPDEFERLFNTLLINVTAFLRDPEAWQVIRDEVIPALLETKVQGSPIRCWSVGCASGEEAYTLAIVLAEQLGTKQFCQRVKIYATDVDQEALQTGRHATYSAADLEPLTAAQVGQYFDTIDDGYIFRRDMRRKIIFGRHDLVQDAPISKIDLLLCRNTLMYFNADTQRQILARFRFALREQGYIFLGKAEMLLAYTDLFEPVNLKHRIFRRLPAPDNAERVAVIPSTNNTTENNQTGRIVQLREAAFDNSPTATLVINQTGMLTMLNAAARELFNLSPQDVGQPLRDLEVSYRPLELRSRIQEANTQPAPVLVRGVQWRNNRNDLLYLDVKFQRLNDDSNTLLGTSISFFDVTRYHHLQQELEDSKQELEVANEELQSTNEELETTNEELQSSNEELETTNEELQSTNEELETMNEELQSTNEELQTVNDELQNSSDELNRSNAFLEAIMASLKRGVVVIDRELIIQVWNEQAVDMWGIRADEAIDTHLLNLDIGLPLDELRQPIRDCLGSDRDHFSEFTLDAINRRGRRIQCRVSCTPLIGGTEGEVTGVILMMEEIDLSQET